MTTVTPQQTSGPPTPSTRRRPWFARRRGSGRYLFAPLVLTVTTAVLFALFFVWPGALGLIYSFTDYRGLGDLHFVGLQNYSDLLADTDFWSSLRRSVIYVCASVPLIYVTSLGIAALLTAENARGRTPAKVIFFLPWLISPIVIGVIWRWMFGENFGFVNYALSLAGIGPVSWTSDADLSLFVVILASAWGGTAFNMMLFIAAILNVPRSYLEAATLDGAGRWQRFRHITWPCIAPTSFMVVLLSTINQMKEFAMIQALNDGGPGTANRLIVQYIYETGFNRARVGYASAVSMILMVILLTIAFAQTRFEKRASRDL